MRCHEVAGVVASCIPSAYIAAQLAGGARQSLQVSLFGG
jgi:hypothetical protein